MGRKKVQVFLDYDDWDYLQKLAKATGSSGSGLIREMTEQFLRPMRKALGDDLSQADAFQFMRVLMGETANILHEASMFPELYLKHQVKAGCKPPEGLGLDRKDC